MPLPSSRGEAAPAVGLYWAKSDMGCLICLCVHGVLCCCRCCRCCLAAGLDVAAASSVPVVFGTAHLALRLRANVQPGQTVLVLGASGGVGTAAVQVCGVSLAGRVTRGCWAH